MKATPRLFAPASTRILLPRPGRSKWGASGRTALPAELRFHGIPVEFRVTLRHSIALATAIGSITTTYACVAPHWAP
jgi:hypothetical protein